MATSLIDRARGAVSQVTDRLRPSEAEPEERRQAMPSRPVRTREPKPEKPKQLARQFRYVGFELASGKRVEGRIAALDETDVREQLRVQGIVIDSLTAASASANFLSSDISIGRSRIKDKEIAAVARQLAVFEGSGLATFKAVGMIAREMPDSSKMGIVLRDVHRSIANGDDLATAFGKHEDKLGTLTVSLIGAGEKSSTLHRTLRQLADMTERQVKLKRKVRSSMAYPIAIAVLSLLAVLASLLFVIPTFEEVYTDFGVELPVLTRMLLGASALLQRFIWALPLVPIGAVFLWRRARRDKEIGPRIDMLLLKLPLFGPILHKSVCARVTDTLSVMLQAGVPTVKAVTLAAGAAGNRAFAAALGRSNERYASGARLSEALQGEEAIPEVLPALISQGEATSNTEELLAKFSEMTQDEVDTKVVALTELLQPLMLLVVMGMIGVLGVGIYLPILGLYDQFTGS